MQNIYRNASLTVLLVVGLALHAVGMVWRYTQGLEFNYLNPLFFLIGLAAYFLPSRIADKALGEVLGRKLLWLNLAAGALLLAAEALRSFSVKTT